MCGRQSGHVFGFVYLGQAKGDDQFALYRREGDPLLNSDTEHNNHHAKHWSGNASNGQAVNWSAKAEGFCQALTPERQGELAQALGLPEHVLAALPIGFSPRGFHADYLDKPCWTFPEVDAAGQIIGISCRYADGKKKAMSGGHRGLTVPDGWRERSGPVLCPEGPSDVLTAVALGLAAIGRPNDKGGVELLAEFLHDLPADRQIIVLAEYDPKSDGRWPGRDGAVKVAIELTERLQRTVYWALPPGGTKDVRRWVNDRQMDLTCADEWPGAGETLLAELKLQEVPPIGGTSAPPLPTETPWPDPLAPEAFHGLAGEIVRTLEPATEADPAGLLFQFLACFGNVVGRAAHFAVEADRHHTNEFVVLLGRTSKGRKGTSWGHIRKLLEESDPEWERDRVQLSSGEGLKWSVRDAIFKREAVKEKGRVVGHQEVEADPGVSDKRLLVTEPEFAQVLKQCDRQGNILSAVIRLAWDSGNLQSMTKNDAVRATGAHVSLIGHCTCEEVRRYLSVTEMASGFGNRFLWVCVQRSKVLPEGGCPDADVLDELKIRLVEAINFARRVERVGFDAVARAVWHKIYEPLSEGKPGLAGALLARGEAHVVRLALLYALLDRSDVIQAPHLMAALALWQYVQSSVYSVFGDNLGDPVADDLLQLLRRCKNGLTRNEIRDYFQRNVSADRIGRALGLLLQHQLARCVREETAGRPAERWYAGREE
jgi:hypothetical protein